MRFKWVAALSAVSTAALIGPAAALAGAPAAAADTTTDVFLSSLDHYRLGGLDPATAVQVGQSVCPMLAEPGQNAANVAAKVADEIGRPLGPATMFTGLAVQIFCPRAVSALTDGVPFSFLG